MFIVRTWVIVARRGSGPAAAALAAKCVEASFPPPGNFEALTDFCLGLGEARAWRWRRALKKRR